MTIQPLDLQRLNVAKNTLFNALLQLDIIEGAGEVAINIEAAFHEISDTITMIKTDR